MTKWKVSPGSNSLVNRYPPEILSNFISPVFSILKLSGIFTSKIIFLTSAVRYVSPFKWVPENFVSKNRAHRIIFSIRKVERRLFGSDYRNKSLCNGA